MLKHLFSITIEKPTQHIYTVKGVQRKSFFVTDRIPADEATVSHMMIMTMMIITYF